MKLFGWIKGRDDGNDRQRKRWRESWAHAVATEDGGKTPELKAELETFQLGPGDDIEVELEMLDALERLAVLQRDVAAGSLPAIDTHHRVVASDLCHFTAPASLPDDPAQASGRVLFTNMRSIFVGGGGQKPIAWHTVREVIHADRDLMLVRADGSAAAHFRFNSYSDAVEAAFLARRLKGSKGTRTL